LTFASIVERRTSKTGTRLRGEFGATLAATSREDPTTSARAHTQTEAVHLGPAAVVRLERSLAHGFSPDE
jgi:hypothetical protein